MQRRWLLMMSAALLLPAAAETLTNKAGTKIEAEIGAITTEVVKLKVNGKAFDCRLDTLSVESLERLKVIVTERIAAAEKEQAAKEAEVEKLGPHGWNKVRWGMTVAQIMDAYPEAVKLRKPIDYTTDGVKAQVPVVIEKFELSKLIFEVRFRTDADDKLAAVILKTESASSMKYDHKAFEELITRKYGAPYKSEATSVLWMPGGVTIRASYGDGGLNKAAPYYLILYYRKPDAGTMEKL